MLVINQFPLRRHVTQKVPLAGNYTSVCVKRHKINSHGVIDSDRRISVRGGKNTGHTFTQLS